MPTDDRPRRCATCKRVQHPYLFAYVDRKTGERDYGKCLPCRSAELNAGDAPPRKRSETADQYARRVAGWL